jgi:hypothetical protein
VKVVDSLSKEVDNEEPPNIDSFRAMQFSETLDIRFVRDVVRLHFFICFD